ncbi:anhydro-N-acetylmuramic acid kinase [Carnobacteriaceae bacterium zg-ZUI252]|nr:anhydro-N-acetylmuramic acid kinase [Carnobacteriaceae bacterium zg-ZUI252]
MGLGVGIMSGTSLDGIDVAIVEIEGVNEHTQVTLKAYESIEMPSHLKQKIKTQLIPETSRVDELCSLNFEITHAFADAVIETCQRHHIALDDIDFVASHGQTLYHQPVATDNLVVSTLQLGEPAVLSQRLKTTVISNLRPADMVVGGQGAPIVPYSEYILYKKDDRDVFLQNIGGIGNVTVLSKDGTMDDVIAFDTGPGNMIIDAFCQKFYGVSYDKNGDYSAQGKLHQPLLDELVAHEYLSLPFPKTTGREMFGQQYAEYLLAKYDNVSANDMIATVTYFTAYCIAYHVKQFLSDAPAELIVGGGGSYNHTLVGYIGELLSNVDVKIQEDIGFSSDAKEAIAMAIIGNQTLHHQPSNVPAATGAKKQVILGSVTYYQ